MKVRCVDCKKRFDYDLYSGVCPKCGNYMRPPEMETSENENCEVEGSHIHTENLQDSYINPFSQTNADSVSESYTNPMPESYTAPYKTPEITSAHVEPAKEKKSNKKLTLLLTVLMITTFLATIIVVYVGQKTVHESKTVKETITPTVCRAKDKFTYTGTYNRYDISIESVTVDEDPEFNLPEEYEAIVVSYHIERTYLNNGGSDSDSYYEIEMTPYLETVEGHYLEPVSEFLLRKVKNIQDFEQVNEMGLGESFEHKDGKLYYYVKKDDIKGLYITSKDYDYEKYESGALREIICVEGLEVTR